MSYNSTYWDPVELASAETIVNRVYVASLTFLLYDHFLTLGEEVTHMWSFKRFEIGKLLFFLNRYGVPLELIVILYGFVGPTPTVDVCRGWYLFQECSSLASLAVVQVSLMLRTWILWGGQRLMLIILCVYLIGCLYGTTILVVFNGNGTDFLAQPNSSVTGCVALSSPGPTFWTFWIPIISFDFVICVLTIIKVIEHRREGVHGRLIDVMDRDGLIYFSISLALSIINMVIFAAAPLHLKAVALPLISATLCATCSRLLLNVRSVGLPSQQPHLSEASLMPVTFELNALARPDPAVSEFARLESTGDLNSQMTPSFRSNPVVVKPRRWASAQASLVVQDNADVEAGPSRPRPIVVHERRDSHSSGRSETPTLSPLSIRSVDSTTHLVRQEYGLAF